MSKRSLGRQVAHPSAFAKRVHRSEVPSCLAVQSEYAPSTMERRHFISRFTGSAGTAVVTSDSAALWTDGRYFLQASAIPPCPLFTPDPSHSIVQGSCWLETWIN